MNGFTKEYNNLINRIGLSINNYRKENNISIMEGNSGLALFLFYYSKYLNDNKLYNKAYSLIESSFEVIQNGQPHDSFASGLAGIGWLIELLEQNDFLESDTDEIIGELDDYLFEYLQKEFKNKHYDYLHGAAGIALYFLKRKNSEKKEKYLSEFVNLLDEMSIKGEEGIKWISEIMKGETEREKVYNVSMSHGIASLISILSKIYTQNINKEKTKILLEGAIKYLLNQEQDTNKYYSYFPNTVKLTNSEPVTSRLAWCYGDLGISVALWNASQALNDKKLENKSLEILLHSSKRRNLQENYVMDASLCHGTAGNAHVFNRMYINTGISEFKETSDYWFNETLKMANFEDGLAGFKVWRTKENGGLINDYGFLEGIAGIGLALISVVSDIEPAWDEALLLS